MEPHPEFKLVLQLFLLYAGSLPSNLTAKQLMLDLLVDGVAVTDKLWPCSFVAPVLFFFQLKPCACFCLCMCALFACFTVITRISNLHIDKSLHSFTLVASKTG